MVGQVGRDGAAGHRAKARACRILDDDAAALRFDLFQAFGSVTAGPRQHDADGLRTTPLRQGFEQAVDRIAGPAPFRRGRQPQVPVIDCQRGRRGNDVDVVGLDRFAVRGIGDRHLAVRGQDIRKPAFAGRIQMHDDKKGQTAVCRHRIEQSDQGFKPACRGPDADHGACG